MFALLLLACSAAEPVESAISGCDPGGDSSLVIGVGETAYGPLVEGSTVELVHGPQGGFHTVLALEARGMDGSDTVAAALRGYIDDTLAGETLPYLNFRCNNAEDSLQVWNVYLVWDRQPEELDGQDVHVTVEVTDIAGNVFEAETNYTIEDPLVE